MRNISIRVESGNITNLDIDMLINSSNGYLIHGSGVAEQIRDAGGYLKEDDKKYWEFVGKASANNETLKSILEYMHSKRPIPSRIQMESLEQIAKNCYKPFSQGDAVFTSSGDLASMKGKAKHISHAIGMDYSSYSPPVIVPAAFETVRDSLRKSLGFATTLKCRSVAIPVMCTRKGGLSYETSSQATLQSIEELEDMDTSVKEVIISLYSKDLENEMGWFKKFYSA